MEDICKKVLEMMLLEPVNWIAVEDNIIALVNQSDVATKGSCEILNFGPGYGMSASRRALPEHVKIRSVSTAESCFTTQDGSGNLSVDDIAIVGMGVDLPGAHDPETLWRNLEEGIDSCTEVKIQKVLSH